MCDCATCLPSTDNVPIPPLPMPPPSYLKSNRGCTSLGKSGTESLAVRPMRPLNGGSGLGSVSCASTGNQPIVDIAAPTNNAIQARENTTDVTFIVLFLSTRSGSPNCVHEYPHTCASRLNQISKEVRDESSGEL